MSAPLVVAFVVGVTPGKWARVWAERMPQHPLDLRPMSAEDALSALRSGEADAALLRLPVVDDALSAIPLYSERAVVVVPKDHAIEAVDSVELADLQPENVLDADWRAAVELVASNTGVAIMPQSVARALSRRDVVARPLRDGVETGVALVWPTARTTPSVEEFIGIVRGRTANSSRGAPTPPAVRAEKTKRKPDRRPKGSGRRR